MATVFLAEDARLGRQVAVKRMHAESPDEVAKRFQREAQLGASMNHPNLVSIFDIEADEENVLIVMEYVAGGTLKDALARGPLQVDGAIKVLRGIGAALDYAHDHDVFHRDVKPANVLLDLDGRAKLADLGIATAAEVTSITRTGAVMGTASYMAPERLDGEPGGRAADIYSLATVAYEVLTGHKARQGRSAVEVAHMVVSTPPPDLRMQMPEAPPEAADALARGMARDPAERPPTAGAFVRELCETFEQADATDAAPDEGTAATAWLPATGELERHDTPAAAPAAVTPHRASTARPARDTPARARQDRRWLLPVVGLVAALLAVAVILALATGDDGDGGGSEDQAAQEEGQGDVGGESESESGAGAGAGEQGGGGEGGSGAGGGEGGGAAGGNPGGADSPPAAAVRDFYTRAAGDDFEGAWELAGPEAREQFGSYDRFVGTLDTLERIEFPTLQVAAERGNSATVRLESVATHTDRVDRCSGTAEVASSGGEWRVGRLSVDCSSGGSGSGKGPDEGKPVTPKKPKKDK